MNIQHDALPLNPKLLPLEIEKEQEERELCSDTETVAKRTSSDIPSSKGTPDK